MSSEPGSEETYLPSDDTALLIESLSSYSGERCLEIGFGSGVVLAALSQRFSMALGTDVVSLGQARALKRGGAAGIFLADRGSCFREGVFDLVAFNPPYLPSDGVNDVTVDGGEMGVEVPMRFLDDALRVLKPDGIVVVLLSDCGDTRRFLTRAERMGLSILEKGRRRLFYETLITYELARKGRPKPA